MFRLPVLRALERDIERDVVQPTSTPLPPAGNAATTTATTTTLIEYKLPAGAVGHRIRQDLDHRNRSGLDHLIQQPDKNTT